MSNDFDKEIKVDSETMKSIKAVEKTYEKLGKKLEFRDKVALAVFNALNDLEVTNEDEKIEKLEYMINLNKIICNYEELRPILSSFFIKKKIDQNRKDR